MLKLATQINPVHPIDITFKDKTVFMRNLSLLFIFCLPCSKMLMAQQTQKPPLHGKNWMAVTGKPLAAEAGATIFQQGGNAVDAACAMLAATCTMWMC